jgi:hypothetical protein
MTQSRLSLGTHHREPGMGGLALAPPGAAGLPPTCSGRAPSFQRLPSRVTAVASTSSAIYSLRAE